MTIEEAAQVVSTHIRKTGKRPAEAIDALWQKLALGRNAVIALAKIGLTLRVSHLNTHPDTQSRYEEIRMERATTTSLAPGNQPILLEIVYVAGEQSKPLYYFTIEEVRELQTDFRSKIAGYQSRLAVLELAERLLLKTGARTIGELPAEDFLLLELEAELVYRGAPSREAVEA